MKARTLSTFGVALLLTLSAAPASAQFTAVVDAPRAKPEAKTEAVAAATPGARTDSAGRTTLSDMKAWVDSAAGVAAPRDSAPRVAAPSAFDTTAMAAPAPTAAPADARRAPDTATMLPGVALLGLLMLGAGAVLLRRGRA